LGGEIPFLNHTCAKARFDFTSIVANHPSCIDQLAFQTVLRIDGALGFHQLNVNVTSVHGCRHAKTASRVRADVVDTVGRTLCSSEWDSKLINVANRD
jgi:hypothetical protein